MERQNEPESPSQGTSEVHSELSLHPPKGEGMSGRFEEPSGGTRGAGERVDEIRDEMTGRSGAVKNRIADARARLGDRAGELREQATSRMDGIRDDGERLTARIQDRADRMLADTGIRGQLERHPLAALGLAFGAGFALAGSGTNKGGRVAKARLQIRGALMTAATAALVREARSMLGMESGHRGGLADMFASGSAPGSRTRREANPPTPTA